MQINLEEADTRIILHAACAKYKGTECILVYSADTDVLVLLVHHLAAIGLDEMYVSTGRTGVHTMLYSSSQSG